MHLTENAAKNKSVTAVRGNNWHWLCESCQT